MDTNKLSSEELKELVGTTQQEGDIYNIPEKELKKIIKVVRGYADALKKLQEEKEDKILEALYEAFPDLQDLSAQDHGLKLDIMKGTVEVVRDVVTKNESSEAPKQETKEDNSESEDSK